MKILHGDAFSVLKGMEENSIDTVYTAPSPFQYYYLPTDVEKQDDERIGGEKLLSNYIHNLVYLCEQCSRVLKPTGNLFIQIPDQFSQFGTLLGVPTLFEAQMKGEGFMLNDRLIWHRTESNITNKKISKYKEKGFLKNYEFIFHFVHKDFYFNTNSKYIKSSIIKLCFNMIRGSSSFNFKNNLYNNLFGVMFTYSLKVILIFHLYHKVQDVSTDYIPSFV
jgi:DNA modification methylase